MRTGEKYHVVVVGAGPAGLHAAIAAAEQGVSVLLFDKKTTIGVPVKCGEFFPSKDVMLDLLPGTRQFSDLYDVPSNAISNDCDTLRMYSPRGKRWEFSFDARVLDRSTLEQLLAEKAHKLGVDIRLGRPARVFRHSRQLSVGPTESQSVAADVIIAADGFPSTTASSGGISSDQYVHPGNVATNYQYLMEDLDIEPNVTEMYTGTSIAPGGYAWIIPKSGSSANVGIGLRTTFTRSVKGRDFLDHFVRTYPPTASKLCSGMTRTMAVDVLPVDGTVSTTYTDTMLMVGDSAGMVMPTNGGGIPTAMVSGRIAGEVAAQHVQSGTPLSQYEDRWKEALGREVTASTRMRRFADYFMVNDRLFDMALRILRTGGIKKVLTCKVPTGLRILMWLLGY
mgnify:CR=1 FL=1